MSFYLEMSFYQDIDSLYSLDYMGPPLSPCIPISLPKRKKNARQNSTAFTAPILLRKQLHLCVQKWSAAPTKAVPISSTSVSKEVVFVPKNATSTKSVPISSPGPIHVPKA